MSLWSRVANVFRGEKLSSEIAEEMDSHIAEAIERAAGYLQPVPDLVASKIIARLKMRLSATSRSSASP